jgi:hypothetical protein
MKGLYKSGLIIFLVFTFLFSTCLIPADTHAKVWMKQEVNFGEPGEDPDLIIDPNSTLSSSSRTTVTLSSTHNNPMKTECVSVWVLHSNILFGQFLGFIF